MAWLLGEEQEQVCDLCGEDADDGPMLLCTNSIWAGKWPGCFGAAHEICIHPPPRGCTKWTCGPCARLSEYAASQQYSNGVLDLGDIDVDGGNVSQDELDAREEAGPSIWIETSSSLATPENIVQRGGGTGILRKESSRSSGLAHQNPPLPKPVSHRTPSIPTNGQQSQGPISGKRDTTSEHGVLRAPRDPTLNKRLKSTFTNIGTPRQRLAKIPKGRDIPVDLLPVNKISKGTTMLKAGGSNIWKPTPGPSAAEYQDKLFLDSRNLKRDMAESSSALQQGRAGLSRGSLKSTSLPMSSGLKFAYEGLDTTCTIDNPYKAHSREDGIGGPIEKDPNAVLPSDDGDLPCADSRLSHAKVDKGSCCMSKREAFDICSFLTDSLGETVAQVFKYIDRHHCNSLYVGAGVINQPKEDWKISPHQEHLWSGLLHFSGQSTPAGRELVGPVEIWSTPTIFPNFGCDVKSVRKLFETAGHLTIELIRINNLPWMTEEYYRSMDMHAQLTVYADTREVRSELTKLSRRMGGNCIVGSYTSSSHPGVEIYLAPGSASSQLVALVRYKWTKTQQSGLGIVKSSSNKRTFKRVSFRSKDPCSQSGLSSQRELPSARKLIDKDNTSKEVTNVERLTPIDTSHAVVTMDQSGQGAESACATVVDSCRGAGSAIEHSDGEGHESRCDARTNAANGQAASKSWAPSRRQGSKPKLTVDAVHPASRTTSYEEGYQSFPPGFGLSAAPSTLDQETELEYPQNEISEGMVEQGTSAILPVDVPPLANQLPSDSDMPLSPREPLRYPRSVSEIKFALIGYEESDVRHSRTVNPKCVATQSKQLSEGSFQVAVCCSQDTVSLIEQLISLGATHIQDPKPTTVNLVSLCKDRFDREGIIGYLPTRDYVDFEIVFMFGLDDLWALALSNDPRGLIIQEGRQCFRTGILIVADHLALRTCSVRKLKELIEGLKEGLRKNPGYLWKLKVSEHSWADLKSDASQPQLKEVLSLLWQERWDPLDPFAAPEDKVVEFMQQHDQSASNMRDIPQVVRDAVKMAWCSRALCRHVILLIGNRNHLAAENQAQAAEKVRASGESQSTIQVLTISDAVQKIRWIVRDSRIF